MLMVIPGHLIFMYTIHYMEAGHTSITFIFAIAYLTAACIQVCTSVHKENLLVGNTQQTCVSFDGNLNLGNFGKATVNGSHLFLVAAHLHRYYKFLNFKHRFGISI